MAPLAAGWGGAAQAAGGRDPRLQQVSVVTLVTCECSRPDGEAHPRQKGSAAAYACSWGSGAGLTMLCRHCVDRCAALSPVGRFAPCETIARLRAGPCPLRAVFWQWLYARWDGCRARSREGCFRCCARIGEAAGCGPYTPPSVLNVFQQ